MNVTIPHKKKRKGKRGGIRIRKLKEEAAALLNQKLETPLQHPDSIQIPKWIEDLVQPLITITETKQPDNYCDDIEELRNIILREYDGEQRQSVDTPTPALADWDAEDFKLDLLPPTFTHKVDYQGITTEVTTFAGPSDNHGSRSADAQTPTTLYALKQPCLSLPDLN